MMADTHGQRIRKRQIAWRLLGAVESLSFIPAHRWLKLLRLMLWLAAGIAYSADRRMDVLLLGVAWVGLEIMLFRLQLLDVLRDKGES